MNTYDTAEVAEQVKRSLPSVASAGMLIAGISIQDWVLVLTAIYTALQIIFLVHAKLWKPYQEKKNGSKRQGVGGTPRSRRDRTG